MLGLSLHLKASLATPYRQLNSSTSMTPLLALVFTLKAPTTWPRTKVRVQRQTRLHISCILLVSPSDNSSNFT